MWSYTNKGILTCRPLASVRPRSGGAPLGLARPLFLISGYATGPWSYMGLQMNSQWAPRATGGL